MPATAIINLRALSGGVMPRSFHCLMHPLFLDRISRADANLGSALHDSGAMAPFSLSPIMGRKRKNSIIANETYWVRISLLKPEVEEVFLRTLETGLWSEPVCMGDLTFLIEEVILGKQEGNPWSGRKSYKEIRDQANPDSKLSLRIVSPLSFKRGDVHYPLPDPYLIFANLARRWNSFADDKIILEKDFADVSYSNFVLRTEPYALRNGGTILGAVGKVTFLFRGDEATRCYYNTLLNFAFFSGIGVKTTQGMGMCRIIK